MTTSPIGYAKNCYVRARPGESLFISNEAGLHVTLDGYVVVPVEDFLDHKKRSELVDWVQAVGRVPRGEAQPGRLSELADLVAGFIRQQGEKP